MKTTLKLIKPHKGQARIIRDFVLDDTKKFGVVCVGRQFGKSLLAMNVIVGWLMTNPKARGGWITPYANQWIKALKDIDEACQKVIASSNKMSGEITFINGSTLKFLSTENENGLRGYTFDYAVVDEAGFVKTSAFNVLRPTFGVKCRKVLMISTPGIKNWFYDYFSDGFDENIKEIVSFKATSYDNPYFPDADIDAAKRTMDHDQFQQEYLAEFSDSSGGVFMDLDKATRVADYVKSSKDECYLGIDIARGGKDHTSVTIMNDEGHVINRESWREHDTALQIHKIAKIIDNYSNCKRVTIETNQEVGIYQELKRMYASKVAINEFYTTRKNKPPLIQNLAADIKNGDVVLPTKNLDPILYNELADFSYVKKEDGYIKYGHTEGKHDDSVISTALANEARVPNRHIRRSFLSDLKHWN